jgi:ribosome-associated protein
MTEISSYDLAKRVVDLCLSKKALDVRMMDLRGISSVTDMFVICHGDSDVQVKAIAGAVQAGLKEEGIRVWHKEGFEYLRWVLLDYVDVVVHVFLKETREFYGLERLWGDAKVETFEA